MTRPMTRLLATVLLLAVALAGAVVGHAQSLTVAVEPAESPAGQTVEIPILVQGSPGFAAMHLELAYDPAVLTVQEMVPGELVAGNAMTAFNTDEAGRVVISIAGSEEIQGDGTLAVARFGVEGAQGQTSPLDLEFGKAWDESGFDLIVDVESDEFTVAANNMPLPLATQELALNDQGESGDSDSGGGGGIGLAIVALVVIAGAMWLFVSKRRRQPATPVKGPGQAPASAIGYLHGLTGAWAGQSVPITTGHLTIGRSADSGVHLAEPSVSRRHAVISYAQGRWLIQDQGSAIGTYVNGQRVQAVQLNSGDRITIGSTEFQFRSG